VSNDNLGARPPSHPKETTMPELKPELAARVQPIAQKWDGFVAKVQTRVQDVLNEAHAGIDQLIAQHATDPGPMGTAMQAVQARFHGLDQKVDESWDKISEEFDEITDEISDDDGYSTDDYDAVTAVVDESHRKYEKLREHIEMQWAWLEMRKQADWARRLYELVQQESQQPVSCSQCGAPFQNTSWFQAANISCPHCGSLNSVQPGTASGLFFAGLGAHAMAHEQAWNEWMTEQQAKAHYDGRRHQTAGDHQHWLDAARTYWTKYYQVTQQMNPGFTQPVEEAVQNRLAQYTSYEQPVEKIQRDFFENLCQTAARNDAAALGALLQNLPSGVDLDECAECLVEHGNKGGAVLVLEHQYQAEGEDDPKDQWIKERMKEIRETLAG
jgi:rubrerythrin